VQKAGYERQIDDKGHKLVKARDLTKNEDYEHNYYKGISEDSLNTFNQDFQSIKESVRANNALNAGNVDRRRSNVEAKALPESKYKKNDRSK
jgi:hypothetical protein